MTWEERTRGLAGTSPVERQVYHPTPPIHGVAVVTLARAFPDADTGASIREVARLKDGLHEELSEAGFPLSVRQINVTVIPPGVAVGLHVHPEQREAWFVVPGFGRLTAYLVDLRPSSPTQGVVSRVVLGYRDTLLGIPEGVLHGYHNTSRQEAVLLYLTSHHFVADHESPSFQEGRVHPQVLPPHLAKLLPPHMRP